MHYDLTNPDASYYWLHEALQIRQGELIETYVVAVPESEKLIAISNYFGVSVDYLLKDEDVDTYNGEANMQDIVHLLG